VTSSPSLRLFAVRRWADRFAKLKAVCGEAMGGCGRGGTPEAGWRHTRGTPEAGWRHTRGRLEAGWRQAGGKLEAGTLGFKENSEVRVLHL